MLIGGALGPALGRRGERLPQPPQGDIIVLARHLRGVAGRIGDALARAEAVLRAWPAAGLALLGLTLVLGVALAAR